MSSTTAQACMHAHKSAIINHFQLSLSLVRSVSVLHVVHRQRPIYCLLRARTGTRYCTQHAKEFVCKNDRGKKMFSSF